MTEPSGNEFSSSAARAWASRLYWTTGGQTIPMGGLEPTVAQPLSKLVAITRAASCCLQHLALDIIGLLHGLQAFSEASRSLARPPKRQQEQEHGEDDSAVAQRRPHPRAGGEPG
ncbi:MAG: hypothetical protein H5U17_14030 [Defluviimonas sp.]|nr:hypothetical protein [Defluviimonas sp.]